MKSSFSLVALSCLLASSLSAEVSTDIKDTFVNGKVTGDIVLYGEQQNNSGSNVDSGFTMGSVGLGYETGDFNGFKASFGFRGNHDFSEVENGDYEDNEQPSALLHTANISYVNKYIALTLGRQEMDLAWMGDFHEAYVGVITAIPDTTITVGHTDRMAVADADAPFEKFTKVNGSDGINIFDVKYEGIKGLALNAYYYNTQDVADWYGAKVDYDTDMFGGTLHYAESNEDVIGADNGSILAVEVRGNFADIGLNLGYVNTDENGIGSMATVGDSIDPLEDDGRAIYASDAKTIYLGVAYGISDVELSAMYADSKYESDKKEKQLNIGVEYSLNDELAIGAVFVKVDADNSDDDYNKFTISANYTF